MHQGKAQPKATMTVRVFRPDGTLKYEERVPAEVIDNEPKSIVSRLTRKK